MKNSGLFKKIFISKFNMILSVFIILSVILISIIGGNIIKYEVPIEEKFQNDNYIEVLDIGEPVSKYIESITSREELEERYLENKEHLRANELDKLINLDFINKVYVIDNYYLNSLEDDNEELKIFSIPNIITDSHNYIGAYPGSKKFLIKGELPKDNKNEAMISYDIMNKYWGFTGDINDIIGSKIKVNNEEYKVVGLTNLPIVTISYKSNGSNEYGVRELIKDDINQEEKLNNILDGMKLQGYEDSDLYFRNIFITYNEGHTSDVINFLVENGPSYQYSSNFINERLMLSGYYKVVPRIISISIAISLMFLIVVMIIGKKSFLMVNNLIKGSENTKKDRLKLYIVLIVDFMITVFLATLLSFIKFESLIVVILIAPFFMITILLSVFAIEILKR